MSDVIVFTTPISSRKKNLTTEEMIYFEETFGKNYKGQNHPSRFTLITNLHHPTVNEITQIISESTGIKPQWVFADYKKSKFTEKVISGLLEMENKLVIFIMNGPQFSYQLLNDFFSNLKVTFQKTRGGQIALLIKTPDGWQQKSLSS